MAEHSVAYFRDACEQCGVLDLHKQMCDFGWPTLGKFAFSSSYVPGQIDDSNFVKHVIKRLGLDEMDVRVAGVRRLFFEAYTVSAFEMRRHSCRLNADVGSLLR